MTKSRTNRAANCWQRSRPWRRFGGRGTKHLAGKTVNLVELSVSHYLLARALEKNGINERDLTLQNTSDSDIGPIFLADTSQEAVVTWNPSVMSKRGPDAEAAM